MDARWTRVGAAITACLAIAIMASSCFSFPEPHGNGGDGGKGAGGASTGCTSDGQCDDMEPCTTDTCGAGETCAHTPLPDGPAPDSVQKLGNCRTVVCQGGKAKDDPDDSDIFDDENDCTIDTCLMGAIENTQKSDGTPCDVNGAVGRCAAGACVVGCQTTEDCAASNTNPCVVPACDTVNSVCLFPPILDNTPTPGVAQVPGDCHVRVCAGGIDVDVVDDGDVPLTPATDCDQEVCTNGTPSNPAIALDTPCNTFNGTSPGHL